MKKRHTVHKAKPARTHRHKIADGSTENYIVFVHGWMFLVAVALMLGVGAIVGNFLHDKINEAPQVAGVTIEAR